MKGQDSVAKSCCNSTGMYERFLSIHTNSAAIVLECMKGSYQYTQIVQQ